METYEVQYEEYKKKLLTSSYFTQKLLEKRKNTLYAEANFIDMNGVLAKIGLLSFACGGLLVFTWVPNMHWAIRFLLIVGAIVCFFIAITIGSQYKETSGRSNFHSFVYDRYIEDRVKADKEMETRNLVYSFLSRDISREEFKQRYEDLSRYDRFARDLQNDYEFNTTIQKRI